MDRVRVEQLRAEVQAVLWDLDPAGVSDDPEWPRTEYDTYIDAAVSALVNFGSDAAAIRLAESIADRMGVDIAPEVIRARLGRINPELFR